MAQLMQLSRACRARSGRGHADLGLERRLSGLEQTRLRIRVPHPRLTKMGRQPLRPWLRGRDSLRCPFPRFNGVWLYARLTLVSGRNSRERIRVNRRNGHLHRCIRGSYIHAGDECVEYPPAATHGL
jgi:hypothetical protein